MNPQRSHPELSQSSSSSDTSTGSVPSLVRYSEDGYRPWILFLIIAILLCVIASFFLIR